MLFAHTRMQTANLRLKIPKLCLQRAHTQQALLHTWFDDRSRWRNVVKPFRPSTWKYAHSGSMHQTMFPCDVCTTIA